MAPKLTAVETAKLDRKQAFSNGTEQFTSLTMSLWRWSLPQEVGKCQCLDGRPEHGGVKVEYLNDPGVLLGVVRREQLGRHLVGEVNNKIQGGPSVQIIRLG